MTAPKWAARTMPNHRWMTRSADKTKALVDVVLGNSFAQRITDAHALIIGQDHGAVLALEIADFGVREMKHRTEGHGFVVPRRDVALG